MPEIRTKTVAYDGVTVIVRERIGSDAFDEFDLQRVLPPEGKRATRRRETFAACVNRTVSTDGLAFIWVTPDSSDDDIRACYENWRRCPDQLLIRWANTLNEVNQAGDSDLAPAAPGEASVLP